MVLPIAASTGLARSTSSTSPPTKIVRVAFWAPSLPPETGASTIARPRSRRRAAKSQLPDGAIVEQSMMSVPRSGAVDDAVWPKRTASTSGVSDTQIDDDVRARRRRRPALPAIVDAELGELRGAARRSGSSR